ncbi:hypothetical protein ACDP63_06285 [Paracoccus sp. P2]|uniref:Nickel/cobalt transporter regulator n=1 Tax=Paracoccus pantotrophus TaxID=82367 RepID=A0A1I5FCP8_PARPN|nr:hypothetical protein [Paracoccus pantotrophus]MDF3853732.1 hypothetical protein [Paracoccus pantotrophus]QFG34711.1 hypothetical protein ESD82_00285 [Paracoccus pantotrophus]QLH12892.1 hypothetical protein HYQ43_00820 [Paracoccus pantotrophus]RDD97478.1 hypothetical protein DTW92_08115 [Paracoccus pantotrophus]RKS43718.1 hypothetical protein BDE18_2534 [Paracoccus pantotrophus]
MFRNRQSLILAVGLFGILAPATLAQGVGQAAEATAPAAAGQPAMLRVGDRLDSARLHPVTRPGLYGMSEAPSGSRYGIVDGKLIRYDPENAQVLSIIRQVDRIMD